MTTQRQTIADLLEAGKSITQLEAYDLGCTRLAAHIYVLRKRGMDIKAEMIQVPTRYGTATVARYSL